MAWGKHSTVVGEASGGTGSAAQGVSSSLESEAERSARGRSGTRESTQAGSIERDEKASAATSSSASPAHRRRPATRSATSRTRPHFSRTAGVQRSATVFWDWRSSGVSASELRSCSRTSCSSRRVDTSRARAIHASSSASVATRATSRTLLHGSSPRSSARSSPGSPVRARWTFASSWSCRVESPARSRA
jgi:hypothetical protein